MEGGLDATQTVPSALLTSIAAIGWSMDHDPMGDPSAPKCMTRGPDVTEVSWSVET